MTTIVSPPIITNITNSCKEFKSKHQDKLEAIKELASMPVEKQIFDKGKSETFQVKENFSVLLKVNTNIDISEKNNIIITLMNEADSDDSGGMIHYLIGKKETRCFYVLIENHSLPKNVHINYIIV